MITKTELDRYMCLNDEKDSLENEILTLRSLAESAAALAYDGIHVQSPYWGSSQEQFLEKITKLIEKYQGKINEIVSLRERIEDEVSRLSEEEARLIRLRYFDGLSCDKCARKMYISIRSFHRLHSEILVKLMND